MKYLRESLEGMIPYHTPYIEEGTILNANESPFNVPTQILDIFTKSLQDVRFNRYPDMEATILKDALAKTYDVRKENIACGVGSDEILQCLFNATITKGDNVVVMDPSFSMYSEYAKIYGAIAVKAEANSDFTFNMDNMLNAIKKSSPKMVILCSPNNPTGILLKEEEVRTIIEATKALVVLDEAYIEFAGEGLVKLVKEYDNLMVLRTFSKLYAGAAIRLGYAISKKKNIDLIDTVRSPYNINTLTQIMAKTIIEHKVLYKERQTYFKEQRRNMYEALQRLNIEVYPTKANFLWMRLSDKINEALVKENIFVRTMTYKGVKYNRVCIGTPEENENFLKVVRQNA